MPSSLTLTNRQHCPAGVTILDQDGQAFVVKPIGIDISFESADPSVAPIEVLPDGMNIDIKSGLNGNTTVTSRAVVQPGVMPAFPDGTTLTDTISVAVENSAPNALNFKPGVPVTEEG